MQSVLISSKLRELRGTKTRKEVADATYITISALTNYECGCRIPRDDVKKRLADYFGVTVDELFYCPANHKSE